MNFINSLKIPGTVTPSILVCCQATTGVGFPLTSHRIRMESPSFTVTVVGVVVATTGSKITDEIYSLLQKNPERIGSIVRFQLPFFRSLKIFEVCVVVL